MMLDILPETPGPLISDVRQNGAGPIPAQSPTAPNVTAGAFADAAHAEMNRYRAVYPDFPAHVDVRDDVSECRSLYFKIELRPVLRSRNERCEARCPGPFAAGSSADQHGREAVAAAVPGLW
jgi:hypothetical protein